MNVPKSFDKEVQEILTNLSLGDAVNSQSIGNFLPKVPEIKKGPSYEKRSAKV